MSPPDRVAAFHWAFGTFMVISVGTWCARFLTIAALNEQLIPVNSLRTMCQKAIDDERRRVQMVVEAMPRRMAKQQEEAAAKGQSNSQ